MSRQFAAALASGLFLIVLGVGGFLSLQLYALNSSVAEIRATLPYLTARTDENRRRILQLERASRFLAPSGRLNPGGRP